MKSMRNRLGASALSLVLVSVATAPAAAAEKTGSGYVQCDGQPNNMTGEEQAARLIGAVALIGLLAPPPEAADASKRKFGLEGVAACTSLLSGDKQELNPRRRLELLLGRAIHQIEAKNYEAALVDVTAARRQAESAGLMADPYFARSRGRAFGMLEGAALFRMGRAEEARSASLARAADLEFSIFGLVGTPTFGEYLEKPSASEDAVNLWRSRLFPVFAAERADRLEMAGRFAEAARIRDALIEFDVENTPELNSSMLFARAAVAHALAGNVDRAAQHASAARANAEKRKSAGKPESDSSAFVELLDFYNIIETARSSEIKTARRLFSARSEWVGTSLGSVLELTKRLRADASSDELIGGLAKEPSQLWDERVAGEKAELLAKDSDNKTLFNLLPASYSHREYEALSKAVWRTDKSKILLKTKKDPAKDRLELLFLPLANPIVAMDAYVLHAALLAKSRGHQGFVFMPILSEKAIGGSFRSGNRGQPGFPAELFIDADQAIAKLSHLIPDPQSLRERQQQRRN